MIKAFKEYLHKIAQLNTSPHSLAFGFALGTLISILPTPGFNILIGFFLVFLFPKISKLTLFAAFALWNPIVLLPLHALSFTLGDLLFTTPVVSYEVNFIYQVFSFTKRYLVGNVILAGFFSLVGYVAVFYAAKKYQSK